MADTVSKKRRTEIMRSVKGKNTTPELIVRKYLSRKGIRYKLHQRELPGSPDIVVSKYKTAIFVNGCFWHRHKNCKLASTPSTNKKFWMEKFEKNKLRDKKNIAALKKSGWKILIFWQCEVEDEIEKVKIKLDRIDKD